MEGKGNFFYINGDLYEGERINGNKDGYVIYKFGKGGIYSGYWKNSLKHGTGNYKY